MLKPILLVFAAALVLYVVSYNAIEHRRVRRGPWVVSFDHIDNVPRLTIDHAALGITNVHVTFPGGELPDGFAAEKVTFDQARPVPFRTPFGRCIFLDTTFLPGTVVLDVFGHEVQFIPRTLTVDGKEVAWQSNATLSYPAR